MFTWNMWTWNCVLLAKGLNTRLLCPLPTNPHELIKRFLCNLQEIDCVINRCPTCCVTEIELQIQPLNRSDSANKKKVIRWYHDIMKVIRGYHAYMIIWKTLVGKCLQLVKEPINRVDKNAVSLVCTNSHCRWEVVVHVQQKSSWLYPYFYPCPIALWSSLLLENTSTIEMNTDWKFL